MADKKISEFPTLESAQNEDLLLISSEYETYNIEVATLKSSLGAVQYDSPQALSPEEKALARGNIDAASASDVTALGTRMTAAEGDIDALDIDERLLLGMIKGTTQTPVFVNGVISSVVHKDGSNNTIRTDTFSLSGNPMVETRTLNTGDVLTISTNLTTLASTITYTPAP